MGCEDYVVVGAGLAVGEVQEDAAGGSVGYACDGGVEEDVVGGEAFHDGVDVGFAAVFEG